MPLFDNRNTEIKNIDRAELYFNGEFFNVLKNRYTIIDHNKLEFKVQNYLSIEDSNKREVFVILKSKMNFKSLMND